MSNTFESNTLKTKFLGIDLTLILNYLCKSLINSK